MVRLLPFALALLLTLPAYVWMHKGAWEQQSEARSSMRASYVLPSKFSRIMALEYKGLLSDYQFLKLVTFFGERVIQKEGVSEEDWDYIVAGLDSITELDPYFLDPYLFGESLLTWEAGRVESANRLLERGMRYRQHDWQFPFFIGFNHFYFLKDFEKGAEYLRLASRLPDSPSFLPNLAARIGYYGNQTKTAVLFLKSLLLQATDPKLRENLERRVLALERASMIEEALQCFVKDHGSPPESLSDMVGSGCLSELPEDPYGGEWVLLRTGRVFSTSRFVGQADGEGRGREN